MESVVPDYVSDESGKSLAEFFERIEREGGPVLDEEDHRLIVETIRSDWGRQDD